MQPRRPGHRTSLLVRAAASAAVLAAATLVSVPAGASSSPTPFTIAYITSLTGPGASETGGSQAGFLARIALQNAEGGVNGHKLVPLVIDDQTSPTGIATASRGHLQGRLRHRVAEPPLLRAAKYPSKRGSR